MFGWDALCLCKTTLFGTICGTIVQPLFGVEHPENDHHNENFLPGLLDATSTKRRFSSNESGLLNFRFERVAANSFIQRLECTGAVISSSAPR